MFSFLRLKAQVKELQSRNIELSNLLDKAHQDNQSLLDRIERRGEIMTANEKEISSLKKDRDKYKVLTREQTEADILLNALKAVGIIKPEKKEDYFRRQDQLMNRLRQSQRPLSQALYGSGLSNLLGGHL